MNKIKSNNQKFLILKKKIRNKKALVGIVGLGYVGLPLLSLIEKEGFKVIGYDIDKKKIELLNNKKNYLMKTKLNFKRLKKNALFEFKIEKLKNADIIILTLPTPLKNRIPYLNYLKNFVKQFGSNFVGKLVILESTSYPGTTQEIIIDFLNTKKIESGKDCFVSYSPERIDPGVNENFLQKIPKIGAGKTKNCKQLIKLFYEKIFDDFKLTKEIETAEFTKILENTFRSVNIAFINEMKKISLSMKINLIDAIKLASTKPYGFMPFYPGPGVGGHCIPIDPLYLSWKAKKIGINLDFIKLSEKINLDNIKKINLTIKNKLKNLKQKNKSVLILGLAYKKNIDDYRESPTLKIMNFLKKNKINFSYNDPYIRKLKPTRDYNIFCRSIKLSKSNLKKHSLVVLVTDHDYYNYEFILNHAKFIIDTRFKYKENKLTSEYERKVMFV